MRLLVLYPFADSLVVRFIWSEVQLHTGIEASISLLGSRLILMFLICKNAYVEPNVVSTHTQEARSKF